jgi:hypothetical protein
MAPPIFIVGANRSGTTLLRLILNAHPRIAIPDELIYFGSHLAGTPIEQWRSPDLSRLEYEQFVEDFLTTNCRPLDAIDRDELKAEILSGALTFRQPYHYVLEAWAKAHGKERWGEKTPGNLFYADIIVEMFPDAQFLYVVRDPRAGVASMQRVSLFPNDVVFNALSRRKHDTQGRKLLRSSVPARQRRTVRYEDLVQNPASTVRSLCDFLGEEYTPSMLRFHEDAEEYMKDAAEEHYNETATHPITDDRVDAWKRYLSAEEVALVESICTAVMEAFGYTPKAPPITLPRRAEMLLKQGYWRYQCWRHRGVRHYTVKHPIFARTRTYLKTSYDQIRRVLWRLSPLHSP